MNRSLFLCVKKFLSNLWGLKNNFKNSETSFETKKYFKKNSEAIFGSKKYFQKILKQSLGPKSILNILRKSLELDV